MKFTVAISAVVNLNPKDPFSIKVMVEFLYGTYVGVIPLASALIHWWGFIKYRLITQASESVFLLLSMFLRMRSELKKSKSVKYT